MQSNVWSSLLSRRLSRRRSLAAAGGTTAAAAFLAACGGSGSEKSEGGGQSGLVTEPTDTLKQAKRGGIMKDRQYADPPTLDVLTLNNPWYNTGYAVYNSFVQNARGHLEPGEPGNVAPDLAESWEVSPDGLQITFKLRQNVKFHNKPPVNGRAMDIDDVLFSWQRFSTKYSVRRGVVSPEGPVLSLNATDARTVVVKISEPLIYATGFFAGSNGSGMYIVPKETDSTLDLRGDMLGTGPWYLDNYAPSQSFTLKRNPEFWDKDWALVDQIDLPIISEYAAALSQLKAGNIYYMGSHPGAGQVTQDDVLSVKRETPEILAYVADLRVTGFPLNFGWLPDGSSPFLDERVRQAVSMSWDRDSWIDVFHNVLKFQSEGLPITTYWNSALPATNFGSWIDPRSKDFGPNAKYFEHNVAEAKKLLAAAGHANGFETVANYIPGPELGPVPKVAEVLNGFMQEVGITSKVNNIDYLKEYVPQFRDGKGQYTGWSIASTAGAPPSGGAPIGALAGPFWSQGGNAFRGFSLSGKNDQSGDPQVDAMIEKGRIEQDAQKRQSLMFDLQRYLAKTVYMLQPPGMATGFQMAWPCIGDFRVWQSGRPHERLWIDDKKPPFKA